jgi:hypothetical protein
MPTIWWVGRCPSACRAHGRRRASALRCARAACGAQTGANALGAVGLVRGQAHQVDRQLDRSMSTRPVACAASTWKMTPFSRHIAPMAGCPGSRRSRCSRTSRWPGWCRADRGLEHVQVEQAVFLHVQVGHLKALALQLAQVSSTALCSVLTVMRCLPLRLVEVRAPLRPGCWTRWRRRSRRSRAGRHQSGGHLATRPFRRPLRLPSPRRGCAKRGCQNARATRGSWRPPRAGRTGWWRCSPCKSGSAGSCPWLARTGWLEKGAENQDLANTLPSANTELGAFTRIGLTTGMAGNGALDSWACLRSAGPWPAARPPAFAA